jgi:hypothetical protein
MHQLWLNSCLVVNAANHLSVVADIQIGVKLQIARTTHVDCYPLVLKINHVELAHVVFAAVVWVC